MKSFIAINKHPAGKFWSFAFGLACIIDGMVRVLSGGWLFSSCCLWVTRQQSRAMLELCKAKRQSEKGE